VFAADSVYAGWHEEGTFQAINAHGNVYLKMKTLPWDSAEEDAAA
jgi:hypothetical protein